MKNARESQLKTCIFVELDEFRRVIAEVLGDDIRVQYDYEGISFECEDEEDILCTEEVFAALQNYYGVREVTSVHADDCEVIGVWIAYKD